MEQKYTAIIRKSKLEYVAICLELNVSAVVTILQMLRRISKRQLNYILKT